MIHVFSRKYRCNRIDVYKRSHVYAPAGLQYVRPHSSPTNEWLINSRERRLISRQCKTCQKFCSWQILPTASAIFDPNNVSPRAPGNQNNLFSSLYPTEAYPYPASSAYATRRYTYFFYIYFLQPVNHGLIRANSRLTRRQERQKPDGK